MAKQKVQEYASILLHSIFFTGIFIILQVTAIGDAGLFI